MMCNADNIFQLLQFFQGRTHQPLFLADGNQVPVFVQKMAENIAHRALQTQHSKIIFTENTVAYNGCIIIHAPDAHHTHAGQRYHAVNLLLSKGLRGLGQSPKVLP